MGIFVVFVIAQIFKIIVGLIILFFSYKSLEKTLYKKKLSTEIKNWDNKTLIVILTPPLLFFLLGSLIICRVIF